MTEKLVNHEFVPAEKMPYYRDLLNELLDLTEGLSNKEIDFIEGLSHWSGEFTKPQAEYLERVHGRHL